MEKIMATPRYSLLWFFLVAGYTTCALLFLLFSWSHNGHATTLLRVDLLTLVVSGSRRTSEMVDGESWASRAISFRVVRVLVSCCFIICFGLRI